MLSQGTLTTQVPPKKFPFAHLKPSMTVPKPNVFSYHVNVLGKYSKKIPKREESALDNRKSRSTVKWWDNTVKFRPNYYKSH